jgi:hypothetical protein
MTLLIILGLGRLAAVAGPNPDCPDVDNVGIRNGEDPDRHDTVDFQQGESLRGSRPCRVAV